MCHDCFTQSHTACHFIHTFPLFAQFTVRTMSTNLDERLCTEVKEDLWHADIWSMSKIIRKFLLDVLCFFFKCWISWWFYLFSLPLISLPSVGSSQCFSELFCQWPDRQWHGQLEEHGEKGRGGSSWWQGHAPASYHCKSPEGLCCQPIRCGENSAFV